MNILYLITGLGGGGAEKVVVDLAIRMTDLGHQVKIAYLKGEVVVRPNTDHIELIYLGLESLKNGKLAYNNYKDLLDRFEPDVVHAHMVHANIFARIARKFIPIPKLICTAHNSNEGGKLRMLAYQFTNNLSDLNTNVSEEATQSFIKMRAFGSDAITIYNGINLEKFKNKKIDHDLYLKQFDSVHHKIILAVGRFNQQKDYPNLLNAIAYLKKISSYKFKVLIAGDGEDRAQIEILIHELNLSEYVILLGRRDDIPELMVCADFFVLPSAYEGFGLVVAEAMACETFVVATDCGGVKEVMGGYGLLAPPQNSQFLAEQLHTAMNMSTIDTNENNKKALHHVQQNFDFNKIIQQWLEIYAR